MTDPWFIFIESNTSGTGRLFARTARDLGCRPALFTMSPGRYSYVAEEGVEVRIVSGYALETLLEAAQDLAAERLIAGVYSSSEYFIGAAAGLARALGLPGPDPVATNICRNKREQRFALADSLTPRFTSIRSSTELDECAKTIEFPVVIKPICGTGSSGVRLCANAIELLDFGRRLLAATVNERGMPIPAEILVEEYLDGPEFSVEMFDGQVVGITRKHLSAEPFFVEVGHDYPAPVDSGVRSCIETRARQAVASLGVGWGPSHVELRVVNGRANIIEINPRLAGGFIPSLVRIATGIDLIRNTLARAMGRQVDLAPTQPQGAALRFILATAQGVFADIRGLDDAAAIPGVCEVSTYRLAGERLSIHGDFRDRIGHIIAAGPTANVAAEVADRAIRMIRPVIAREGTAAGIP